MPQRARAEFSTPSTSSRRPRGTPHPLSWKTQPSVVSRSRCADAPPVTPPRATLPGMPQTRTTRRERLKLQLPTVQHGGDHALLTLAGTPGQAGGPLDELHVRLTRRDAQQLAMALWEELVLSLPAEILDASGSAEPGTLQLCQRPARGTVVLEWQGQAGGPVRRAACHEGALMFALLP